jgi:hypothetical protein
METTKRIILISYLALGSILCHSQTPAQWSSYQSNEVKNCQFMFEGKVIKQVKQGGTTCSVIQISKIFKGSPKLSLGTIKVITTIKEGAEKFPQLKDSVTYVIFGNLRDKDSAAFKSIVTANNLVLWCNDWVTYLGTGAQWGWRRVTKYATRDAFYSFLKANGLTVQQEVKQK